MATKNENTTDVAAAMLDLYVQLSSATPETFATISDLVGKVVKTATILRQDHDDIVDRYTAAGNLPEGVKRIRKAREAGEATEKVNPVASIFG